MRVLIWLWVISLAASAAAFAEDTDEIRFGVQVAPARQSWDEIVDAVQFIEELGYDHLWVNDHFIPVLGDREAPQFESWTTLSAIVARTERIRIGVLVTGNTYRHPSVLAKMATTVDHASGGRLNFGIGAGWEEFEHRAYGIPFHTAKERADRLAESLEVITRLWTQDRPSYEGEFYRLHEAPFAPKPVQKPHPPIVVGGQGKKWIMPTVARYADEWNVPVGVEVEGIRERMKILREECRQIGRSSCVDEVSVFLPLANMTEIPLAGAATRLAARWLVDERVSRSVLAGSAEKIRERIGEYIDAGATSVIITTRPDLDRELIRRFAEEIVPTFR